MYIDIFFLPGECCVGMLIDLSSPVVEPDISNNENEDPNATCPIVEPDISNNNENEDANATFTFTGKNFHKMFLWWVF